MILFLFNEICVKDNIFKPLENSINPDNNGFCIREEKEEKNIIIPHILIIFLNDSFIILTNEILFIL